MSIMQSRSSGGFYSYRDAVDTLRDADEGTVEALDKLFGGGILAVAALAGPGALAALSVKTEVSKLTKNLLVNGLKHATSLEQRSRSDRIAAAHAILVLSSLWGAIESALGMPPARAGFVPHDQGRTFGQRSDRSGETLDSVRALFDLRPPLPSPTVPRGAFNSALLEHLKLCCENIVQLLPGLAIWDTLDETSQVRLCRRVQTDVPGEALRNYVSDYIRLAADVHEFFVWTTLTDTLSMETLSQQQRDLVLEQQTKLDMLSETTARGLESIAMILSAGRPVHNRPTGAIAALVENYKAALRLPLVRTEVDGSSDPNSFRLPELGQAYVRPAFRTAVTGEPMHPEREVWWSQQEKCSDIRNLLVGALTSPILTTKPLVVLGHPGAGKSVLSRVLVAELPFPSFVPLLVELRDPSIKADVPVREQIEAALRNQTGGRVQWADMGESYPDSALLVVLDGFDELLQASGLSRADYLEQVVEFQRVEASNGVPVTVIVTSRTIVADRVRYPDGTLLCKLEPFDFPRVGQWLDAWANCTRSFYASQGRKPLSVDHLVSHMDMAEQPLLLLMLALYDTESNSLRAADGGTERTRLYEDLLTRFVGRELLKQYRGRQLVDLGAEQEMELDRLSIVALGMFNRGQQYLMKQVSATISMHLLWSHTPARRVLRARRWWHFNHRCCLVGSSSCICRSLVGARRNP